MTTAYVRPLRYGAESAKKEIPARLYQSPRTKAYVLSTRLKGFSRCSPRLERQRNQKPLPVAQLLVALLEDVEPLRLHRDLGDELGELLDLVLERRDLGRLLAHRLAHHL